MSDRQYLQKLFEIQRRRFMSWEELSRETGISPMSLQRWKTKYTKKESTRILFRSLKLLELFFEKNS